MKGIALLCGLLCSSVLLAESDEVFSRLVAARSLRCTFGPGVSTDWSSGKPVTSNAAFDTTLQFDGINTKEGKARLIGNQGASDLAVLLAASGLTFIEQTGAGNFSITTVFADYAKGTKDFIAVHSRHMGGLGTPLPSQYNGSCKVWQ